MRILAIDPGYERLGIAVLDKEAAGKEEYVYSGCFRTDAKKSSADRLLLIGNEVSRVIKKYAPEELILESLFLSNNQKTAMLVSCARGVLMYIAAKESIPVYEYSPPEIKLAVTGHGRSDKKQIMTMVDKLISIPKKIELDDEYDAIAIGLTHLAHKRISRQ